MTSRCSSCNAEIIWVKTAAGKNMPLNAAAQTMWLVETAQVGAQPTGRPVAVRTSHFSDCPNAAQHRSPR